MIVIPIKRSSFLFGGGDLENDIAYPALYYGGFGIHCYSRVGSGEDVLEGYLRRGVVLSGCYSPS